MLCAQRMMRLGECGHLRRAVSVTMTTASRSTASVSVSSFRSQWLSARHVLGGAVPGRAMSGLSQGGDGMGDGEGGDGFTKVVDSPVDWAAMTPKPLPRVGETIERKRARLIYQVRKRGILETDLILSTFASKYLPTFAKEELDFFDHLLDQNDWDIYYWASKAKPTPEEFQGPVMDLLQEHAQNKEKVVLRMPDLDVDPSDPSDLSGSGGGAQDAAK